MSNLDPELNKLYAEADDLHASHWEKLEARDPEEVARAADCDWNGNAFRVTLLGRPLKVEPGARKLAFLDEGPGRVGYQRALVAVGYLGNVMEAEPSGEWKAFRGLPGGDGFFRGPHALNTQMLETVFGNNPQGLVKGGEKLGGKVSEGADAAVEFQGLPRIPLKAMLYAATEEFGASASLLIDGRSHLHLALDILWALSNLAIADLIREGSG